MITSIRLFPLAALLLAACQATPVSVEAPAAPSARTYDVDPDASVESTTTSIIGLNHIGISVTDLDTALAFYEQATGFELVRRESISENRSADQLFDHQDIAYEVAVLKAPNMLLELTEFAHNQQAIRDRMPAKGPGMTHTCFQSPAHNPGWPKFVAAGADPLTWGGEPVDLGGYGVTYGYAYDPDGNMIELEQLDGDILARSGYDPTWSTRGEDLWMTQVALVSHDIDRLMAFYEAILGFKPYRRVELGDNARADEIVGYQNMRAEGGWFRIGPTSKVIEFWQYINPVTAEFGGQREATALGYSFSLEVTDIQREYTRMSELGVTFFSEPMLIGGFHQVYARDIDGNVFSLRQALDPASPLSVRQLDR